MTLPPVPIRGVMTPIRRAYLIDHDSGTETEIGVDAAQVVIDRKSVARRIVDAHVYDADPRLLAAPHRLRLVSGYRVAGTDYTTNLAHVRIGRRSTGQRRGWSLTGCTSFESIVAGARFSSPRTLAGGTSMLGHIVTLISEAVPWATIRVDTARDALVPPGGVTHERERWGAIAGEAESLATALGIDVACDGSGTFVLRDRTTVDTWAIADTDLLVDWREETDPASVVNAWSCASDHPDVNPVWGEAVDTDPYSPSRVARWGEVRNFPVSPYYGEAGQCEQAALSFLAGSRGQRADLDLTAVPNPWLDEWTAVAATRDGATETHELDRIVHGWRVDEPMTLTAASRLVSVQ